MYIIHCTYMAYVCNGVANIQASSYKSVENIIYLANSPKWLTKYLLINIFVITTAINYRSYVLSQEVYDLNLMIMLSIKLILPF